MDLTSSFAESSAQFRSFSEMAKALLADAEDPAVHQMLGDLLPELDEAFANLTQLMPEFVAYQAKTTEFLKSQVTAKEQEIDELEKKVEAAAAAAYQPPIVDSAPPLDPDYPQLLRTELLERYGVRGTYGKGAGAREQAAAPVIKQAPGTTDFDSTFLPLPGDSSFIVAPVPAGISQPTAKAPPISPDQIKKEEAVANERRRQLAKKLGIKPTPQPPPKPPAGGDNFSSLISDL